MNTTEAAVARWLVIHDELLRGITHALSNRIATIAAAAYLLEQSDVPIEQTIQSLRTENERMDTVLQQLRQLPERPGADAEPMTVDDACATAVKVHAHHGELREAGTHNELLKIRGLYWRLYQLQYVDEKLENLPVPPQNLGLESSLN